jgi:hypothetical protein
MRAVRRGADPAKAVERMRRRTENEAPPRAGQTRKSVRPVRRAAKPTTLRIDSARIE